ncbi:MAG: OadG family protein [Clostridia bacterium]|nr:OadG family protein [Clostridia bacterium]
MDKLFFGLGVAALGMITVFSGLVILIVFITLLSKFTAKEGKKKTESKSGEVKEAAKNDVPDDVMAAISAAIAAYDQTPSPEVVAAIAAALNIVMGEGKFVVRHIKRINNAPAWNRAGREEQIYSRF